MEIYCQGRILPEEEATLSACDHGILYGAALFETFRTYRGSPFLLAEHLARLQEGCRAFGIVLSGDLLITAGGGHRGLEEMTAELLRRNRLEDGVFRYTLSAGAMPAGLPADLYREPTELLLVRPLPQLPASGRLHLLHTVRTEPEARPRPKSAQYMNSLIAWRELRERSPQAGDEGLLLTRDGRLAEGIASNLFLVQPGGITTPSPEAHILEGITRRKVLDLAASLGIKATETELSLPDLTQAEAIFLTNSVRGITPVHQVLDPGGGSIWEGDSAGNRRLQELQSAYTGLQHR